MAIDPGIFIPVDRFKRQVTEYLDFVKRSRRMKGVAEILIPGERSERSRERCREQGILIDDELLEQIRDLSSAAGMA